MKELCVVHLVRAANAIEPFKRFLDSYQKNPAGTEHDLLIVFKGFESPQAKSEYYRLLVPVRHETMDVSDEGLDITAYFTVIGLCSKRYRYFCFLNSYSEILDQDWLKKLHDNICASGIGLVGATGSWLSHRTNASLWFQDFPAHLRRFGRRMIGAPVNPSTETSMPHTRNVWKKLVFKAEWIWHRFLYLFYFDPFPNYLVRTNAFMISGWLMESLNYPPVKTKFEAYVFESGKKGLTKRILALGKKVLIVGKDGKGYEKETWDKSGIFHQSDQENLLVADNQTNDYQHGSPERRRLLNSGSWHPRAYKA